MRVAVIGGTGSVGSLVARELAARGDEVRVVSRRPPAAALPAGAMHARADLTSGEGLREAVDGMEAVVDAANETRAARRVIVDGTARLLAAEADAGVAHHVEISIVGCDRASWSYYDAKVEQEAVVAGAAVPWSLLRATQFHTLLERGFAAAARLRVLPTGSALLQPIDPLLVAHRLAEAVHAGPGGRLPDIAGPEIRTVAQLAHDWREHLGRSLLPVRVPFAGKAGRAMRAGGLCDASAAAGGPTFAEWLAGGSGRAGGGAS